MGNVKKTPHTTTMEMKFTVVDIGVVVDKVVPDLRSTGLDAMFIGYNAFAAAVTELRITVMDYVNEGRVEQGRWQLCILPYSS